jgi:hypothetical protein
MREAHGLEHYISTSFASLTSPWPVGSDPSLERELTPRRSLL